jgi:tetratricopeptide (TPR) repeat protein
LAWHEREATESEMAGQWFAVVFHLSRLIDAQPEAGNLRLRRAYAYAELGREDMAARDFDQSLESVPTEAEPWHAFARQRLDRHDVEGYRKICGYLLRHFSKTQNPATANSVAWTCVLAPDAVADPLRPVRLAELAVGRLPENDGYLNTLGAALYRAGKFEEAVQQLSEAIKVHGEGGTYTDWLFLAMAHHRLGHADEANRWLAKAVAWIDKALAGKPRSKPDNSLYWWDRLEMRILRREAEALLKDRPSPPKAPQPRAPQRSTQGDG